MDDFDWTRLIDQLQRGDCTPVLGAGINVGTLPTGRQLSDKWMAEYVYPFEDTADLAEVTQYASVLERDAVTVKQRVVDQLSNMGVPDFLDPSEPHAVLARFPISVYLTTNYDDFMTQALQRERKEPTTIVCPWYRGADNDPGTRIHPGYGPRADNPLVFHLHGSLRSPSSLVLTEQDSTEFLVQVVRDQGMDERRVVPTQVLQAVTRAPLLFIGYSLRDVSFRMLFHGLLSSAAEVQRRRHVSVQLLPPTSDPETRRRAQVYLTSYYQKLNISVFWGSVQEFCSELAQRLGTL